MSSAFQLSCRIARCIQKQSDRAAIGTLLMDPLRHTPGEKMEMLNPVFQLGRDRCHQFASYLRAHANYTELAMGLPEVIGKSVKPLEEETLKAFAIGHCSLRFISQSLVHELVDAGGTVFEAADPYFFDENLPMVQRLQEESDVEALNEPVAELAILLSRHPLVSRVKELMLRMTDEYGLDKIANDVIKLENVVNAEIEENVLLALRGKVRQASFETNCAAQLLTAVYVLQRCIETILQISFQAYTQDKMPTLNLENIYNVPQWNINSLGRTVSIDVQPIGDELFARPRNILYIDLPTEDGAMSLNGPVFLNKVNVQFSAESGMECNFEAQVLDEWLNPYPGLLH